MKGASLSSLVPFACYQRPPCLSTEKVKQSIKVRKMPNPNPAAMDSITQAIVFTFSSPDGVKIFTFIHQVF
jgi:hypothetical protein